MNVDPSETPAIEPVHVDEMQQFGMVGDAGLGNCQEKTQDLASVLEPPTRQLANHEGMANHMSAIQQRSQPRLTSAEVVDPNGCIYQDPQAAERRRLTGRSAFSVPPSFASR